MASIDTDTQTLRIEISPRSYVVLLSIIGVLWLSYTLRVVIAILVMALIVAGTLHPAIKWLEAKGVQRLLSLVLVFLGSAAVVLLVAYLTLPSLADQITRALHEAPEARARLIQLFEKRNVTIPLARLVREMNIDKGLAQLQSIALGYSSEVLRLLAYTGTVLVLAFYLLADGTRTQGMVFALVPRDYHMRLARILQHLERIVGGYMRGQLITCLAIGIFTFVVLAVFHVPGALSVALFAAIVDIIPLVGGVLVIVPAVLAALPMGVPTALAVLGLLMLYEQFENRFLVPRVYGEVLRLSSTAVILALASGTMLLGVLGAFLALPVVAGLVMVLQELRVEMPGDDSINDAERRKHAEAEATYEARSAGSTAPEAGEIARVLADEIAAEEAPNSEERVANSDQRTGD